MKVFACTCQYTYGGGLIVVAANTKEEAFITAASDEDWSMYFTWFDNETNHVIQPDGNINHIHTSEFPLNNWRELDKLTANVDKPQVIDGDAYVE